VTPAQSAFPLKGKARMEMNTVVVAVSRLLEVPSLSRGRQGWGWGPVTPPRGPHSNPPRPILPRGEERQARSLARGPGCNRPRRSAAGFSNHNTHGQAQSRASRQRVDRRLNHACGLCHQPSNFPMTESFAELFEQSQTNLAKLKPGAIVTGTVVQVRTDVVVINAGLKSEGIVPIEQFRNDAGEIDVAEGDVVKVALDSLENGFGETVLS